MSKCDIRITFDKADRTYRGGELVSGEVHIDVNKDIRCNGIILTHYWKTHGRGNTDSGERHKIRLVEMLPLQAGEELHLPFEFTAERWPLTYRGHYVNVDHYVHVAVDVPWAIDPKHEEEYILLVGDRPPEITGDRSEVIAFARPTTQVSGLVKFFLYGILAIFAVMLSALFVVLIPVFLICGSIYWVWRTMIASRIGDLDLKIPHIVVGPGEQWPVELTFTPKKTFSVNGITLRIFGQESATSGSGTNKTTHHHTILDQSHTLYPAGQLMAGEQFSERFVVDFPQSDAWNLNQSDNNIKWWAEVRIDIPRFPDWGKKTELQLVPLEFLDDADPGAVDESRTGSPTDSVLQPPSGPAEERSSTPSVAEFNAAVTGGGEDMAPLLALVQEIQRAGRFGNERSEIVAAAEGHTYDITVVVDRITTTFGFAGDSEPHEHGKTIIGTLLGTQQEVQLFTVEAGNPSVERVSRGETWQTLATVKGWDSLYNRLVLHEVPFD